MHCIVWGCMEILPNAAFSAIHYFSMKLQTYRCMRMPNVDVDALHSLRKQLTFCDFAAVSPRNDWRNSILMTCQYSDLGWATDWLYYERNLLQPIRSTSQIWVVMRHQCGISEVFAQKSFHRKTSGVVIKCQLFSLALLYSVQKKLTSCKWRAGFWVMPPPTTSPDKFSKTARSMHLLLTGFRRSKMPRFPIMSIIVLEVVYNMWPCTGKRTLTLIR